MILLFSLSEITGVQAAIGILAPFLIALLIGKAIWGSYKQKYYDAQDKTKGYQTRTGALEKELKSLRTQLQTTAADLETTKANAKNAEKEFRSKDQAYLSKIASMNSNLALLKEASVKLKTDYEGQIADYNRPSSEPVTGIEAQLHKYSLELETINHKFDAEIKGYQNKISRLEKQLDHR